MLITLLGCLLILQIASSQNIAPGLNNNIAAQANIARNTALVANTPPGNMGANAANILRNTNEANVLLAANDANLRGLNEANAYRGSEANNYRAVSEANAIKAANQANIKGYNDAQKNEANFLRNANGVNTLRASHEANALRNLGYNDAQKNEANFLRNANGVNTLRASHEANALRNLGYNDAQKNEANFLRNANGVNTLRASHEANALRNLDAAQFNSVRTGAVESNTFRNSPRDTVMRAAPNEAAAIRATEVINGFNQNGISSGIGGFSGFLGQNLPIFNGGSFEVMSSSPIAPVGLSVIAKNLEIDGAVAIGGNLPFLGSAIVEGMLPATGRGAVLFGTNSESFGIRDLQNNFPQSSLTDPVNSNSLRINKIANELAEPAGVSTPGNIQHNNLAISQGLRMNPSELNIGMGSMGLSGKGSSVNINNSPLGNFQISNRGSVVS